VFCPFIAALSPLAIVLIIITFAFSLWLVKLFWLRLLLLVLLAILLLFMWRIPVVAEETTQH